ncbi:unnamed protein product [Anisakis simplex]|uniref:CTCHY-type domain-containing protein n=1 Tax=Anisakis simplex TaxID=6269 RepID=A0A0M3J5P5_ANISI|nr:unnamed protein product [Anisakis simplex]
MRMEFKSFLLDIDARMMPFYLSKQFAQFSMLTGHFYDSNSTKKLESFLKSVKNLIIVCDPPFGIMVEALFRTIRQLKDKFLDVHQKLVESVRIVPNDLFCRFCEMCERYVANENRHCGLCGICPSKVIFQDGTSYRHCARCNRCVKCKYLHCSKCGRCHLAGRCLET